MANKEKPAQTREEIAKKPFKLANKEGIHQLTYYDEVECYCPLGKDLYTNEIKVVMEVDKFYPDYDVVALRLREIHRKQYNIEMAVQYVLDMFIELEPIKCEVESTVSDAGHPPVTVVKKYVDNNKIVNIPK